MRLPCAFMTWTFGDPAALLLCAGLPWCLFCVLELCREKCLPPDPWCTSFPKVEDGALEMAGETPDVVDAPADMGDAFEK